MLQLLRRVLLGYPVSPQRVWTEGHDGLSVGLLDIKTHAVVEALGKAGMVIVPTDSVEENPIARNLPTDAQEKLCTPAQVKGLEYGKVVLLGAGAEFAARFPRTRIWDWRRVTGTSEVPENLRYEVEYFLNRLYVSVTRARERLFLVDSQKGFEQLWRPLAELVVHLLKSETELTDAERKTWRDLASDGALASASWQTLLDTTPGNPAELEEDHPRDLGELFFRQSKRDSDPALARKAEHYLRIAGEAKMAASARAYAIYFEGDRVQAARILRDEASLREQALDWLLEARAWSEISTEVTLDPSWERKIELAQLMCLGHTWSIPQLQDVRRILDKELSGVWEERHREAWTEVLIQFCKTATSLAGVSVEEFRGWLDWLQSLRRAHDLNVPPSDLAKLAHRAGEWSTATSLWEQSNKTGHSDYHESKARSTPYPACLKHWQSAAAGDPEANEGLRQLRLAYRDNGSNFTALDNQDLTRVYQAMASSNDPEDLAEAVACQLYHFATLQPARAMFDSKLLDRIRAHCTHPETLETWILRHVKRTKARSGTALDRGLVHLAKALTLLRESDAASVVLTELTHVDEAVLWLTETLGGPDRQLRSHGTEVLLKFLDRLPSIVDADPTERGRFLEYAVTLLWKTPERRHAAVEESFSNLGPAILRPEVSNLKAQPKEAAVLKALRCIPGPRGWLRDSEGETLRTVRDYVDSIAEAAVLDARSTQRSTAWTASTRSSASKKRRIQRHLPLDLADYWRTVADAVEESSLRKHPSLFYEALQRLTEDGPAEVSREISDRYQRARRDYVDWQRGRAPRTMGPGEEHTLRDTLLKILPRERHTAIIRYLTEELAVRADFWTRTLTADSGLVLQVSGDTSAFLYRRDGGDTPDWEVRLRWKDDMSLEVRLGSDTVFLNLDGGRETARLAATSRERS